VVVHGFCGGEHPGDPWLETNPDSWLVSYAESLESDSRIIKFSYDCPSTLRSHPNDTLEAIRLVSRALLDGLVRLRDVENNVNYCSC
jgi:hypothetical protein